MGHERIERLAADLEGAVGESLRTVAIGDLDDLDHEVAYMRPDVDARYDREEYGRIVRDVLLEQVASAQQADLFAIGALEYTVRIFEEGINVVGRTNDSVFFVGLDPDPEAIPRVVECCRAVDRS
ncbi:MAG: hypothetical protein QXG03_01445 [Halalkalicoccus sp.]